MLQFDCVQKPNDRSGQRQMTMKQTLFLCTCDNSQKIDAKAIGKALDLDTAPKVYEQLCRSQIEALSSSAAAGHPATICCTQEIPVFLEAWAEVAGEDITPHFVNIRENAGWSEDGPKSAAKMAALIDEAHVSISGSTNVSMNSDGCTLILGNDDTAIDAAKRLAPHLDVTVLLTRADDILPPAIGNVPVLLGKVTTATGYLGKFQVNVEGLCTLDPSSRGRAIFGRTAQELTHLNADILIDLRGTLRGTPALFPAPKKRDGYLQAEPGNPADVERALFDALNLVGEFEKPRYVLHTASQCAHSRNSIIACTRCLDACPTSAIQPAGDHVAIDPYICAGCGECSSVCPTGANSYQYPSVKGVMARAHALLGTFQKGGDSAPVLLITNATDGVETIAMMARYGRGLPARVLPFTQNTITSLGLDTLLSLMAYGSSRILLLANPAQADELSVLHQQIGYANAILHALGYGEDRITVVEEADPSAVEQILWSLPKDPATPTNHFTCAGEKRETLSQALIHLHAAAPTPQDRISLPDGAPFGEVIVDVQACTLCLACTSACPTGALKSNPERPELRFREAACVQCGLCLKTCPEKAITLSPSIDFTGKARNLTTLKSEEPFACISCGKPFGTKASIERMAEKLKNHSMFSGPGGMDRLRMCEDCRVFAMADAAPDPFASGIRPLTRTTDDYLREREATASKDDLEKLN